MTTIKDVLTQLCKDFLAAEGDIQKQAQVAGVMYWTLERTKQAVAAWNKTATKQ